jgi:hypothetical protein
MAPEDRLLAYPWSSFPLYLWAPKHRPRWLRVERLLCEHGIAQEAGWNSSAIWNGAGWRKWTRMPPGVQASLVYRWRGLSGGMPRADGGKLGENHPGQTRLESAEVKADRIIAEELSRPHWTPNELATQAKSHPAKLALAARLRQETTLSVKDIAGRLSLGKPKGARTNLYKFLNHTQIPDPRSELGI